MCVLLQEDYYGQSPLLQYLFVQHRIVTWLSCVEALLIYAVVPGVRLWTSTSEDRTILWDFAVMRSRKEGREVEGAMDLDSVMRGEKIHKRN